MLAKLFRVARLTMLLEVAATREDAHPAISNEPAVQCRILESGDSDRYVGATFEQIDDTVVGVELQGDMRIALSVALHERHDHMQHKRCRGVDPQPPRRHFALCDHQLLRVFDGVDDRSRMLKEE